MSGFSDFLVGLTDTQWDVFIQVFNDLQDSTSPDRLESLRQFLSSLTKEIDAINKKRDAMGQKAANIDALTPLLEGFLRQNPECLEVELLRNVLLSWKASLKTEITETRPDDKLDRKYSTERKREFLIQLQRAVMAMVERIPEAQKVRMDGPHVGKGEFLRAEYRGK